MTEKEDVRPTEEEGPPNRRDFMKVAALTGAAAAAIGAVGKFAAAPAAAQNATVDTTPWWPSRWGADDEAGASNWITPEKVLDAAKWIRDGKLYRIGRVYQSEMPKFGPRAFTLRIPGNPTGGPLGNNKLVYMDEFLATEIGQTGTQFDGLGHIGQQLGKDGDLSEIRYYNGVSAYDLVSSVGLKKLGIDKVKPFFTRGHLIDVQALRGAMWDAGEEITVADIEAALAKQGMSAGDIKEGDAVFFNTGWGSLWMENNDRFASGEPGIGVPAAKWLAEKNVCVVGADCWGVEVVPNPDKVSAFAAHQELIMKNGIFIHENLRFDELIADGKHSFVYVFSPAPIKGGTGSNGGPIALT